MLNGEHRCTRDSGFLLLTSGELRATGSRERPGKPGRESRASCGTLSGVGAHQCINSWHMGNRTSASGPGFKSQRG